MNIIFNQIHGIKLMKMFFLINKFEIHQFLYPFHCLNALFCQFFECLDLFKENIETTMPL